MQRKFTFFVFIIMLFGGVFYAQNRYVENRVIVKLKKNCSINDFLNAINSKNKNFGEFTAKNLFPNDSKGLGNIFAIEYSSPVSPKYAASVFSKNECLTWAEPDYIGKLAGVVPNDEKYSAQWYLRKIDMENAWAEEQCDGDIVVAVVDNGLDISHPDLSAQIWTNPDETADGIDNDNDGFVDDIYGWDFGNNDNTITHDGSSYHGTQVAGLIGATTDNGIGIASVGFNVKIMGLKITDLTSDTEVIMSEGYRAIVYAADHGADVINCSWGNYGYSHLGQEAVNYATGKNVVVIGAAGNDGANDVFYPARYENVLAVGATDSSDAVWSASNYGYYVDLMSPGKDVISTGSGNGYETASGTSLATPLVSGVAALLKKHFPVLSARAIAERIRVSSDDIYGNNAGELQHLLGYGRVNAYNALTDADLKSVRATLAYFVDYNDNVFLPGENVDFVANFYNYLAPTTNLVITLQTDDPYVSITQGVFNAGAVVTSGTVTNALSPFKFTVNADVPENYVAHVRLEYSDGAYSDFQWFEVMLNPTYSDMNVNNLDLTVTSKGTLGYEDYPYNTKGNGLTYCNDNKTRFFEAGFLYGTSETQVMDALHIMQFSSVSNDFNTLIPFSTSTPGIEADQQGFLMFNDNNAGANKLNVATQLFTYAFSDEENQDYVILRYRLTNLSDAELSGLYAGLYFDWDLDEDDYADDIVGYDSINNFGYAYDNGMNTISTYQGVALVSDTNYNFWANANDGSDGGINVENFTDAKKWTMLSSGLTHITAGPSDISFVISGGPYSVGALDSIDVAFAVAIAPDLENLAEIISRAKNKYYGLPSDVEPFSEKTTEFVLYQNAPNPFNPVTTIKYGIPSVIASERSERGNLLNDVVVTLNVYNILGEEIATLVNEKQSPGNYTVQFDASNLPSGVYFYTLRVGNFIATKKMILLK